MSRNKDPRNYHRNANLEPYVMYSSGLSVMWIGLSILQQYAHAQTLVRTCSIDVRRLTNREVVWSRRLRDVHCEEQQHPRGVAAFINAMRHLADLTTTLLLTVRPGGTYPEAGCSQIAPTRSACDIDRPTQINSDSSVKRASSLRDFAGPERIRGPLPYHFQTRPEPGCISGMKVIQASPQIPRQNLLPKENYLKVCQNHWFLILFL